MRPRGRIAVKRRDERVEEIGSDTVQLEEGDEVVVETPGGGGYREQ